MVPGTKTRPRRTRRTLINAPEDGSRPTSFHLPNGQSSQQQSKKYPGATFDTDPTTDNRVGYIRSRDRPRTDQQVDAFGSTCAAFCRASSVLATRCLSTRWGSHRVCAYRASVHDVGWTVVKVGHYGFFGFGGAILFSALRTSAIGVRPDQSPACWKVPSINSVEGVTNTP